MSVFFSGFIGVWIVARTNKSREPRSGSRVRGSRDLFVRATIHTPMNPEKKTLIPYIYNVSNKDSF